MQVEGNQLQSIVNVDVNNQNHQQEMQRERIDNAQQVQSMSEQQGVRKDNHKNEQSPSIQSGDVRSLSFKSDRTDKENESQNVSNTTNRDEVLGANIDVFV